MSITKTMLVLGQLTNLTIHQKYFAAEAYEYYVPNLGLHWQGENHNEGLSFIAEAIYAALEEQTSPRLPTIQLN